MRTYLQESAQPALCKSHPMAKSIRLREAAKVNTSSPDAFSFSAGRTAVCLLGSASRTSGSSALTLSAQLAGNEVVYSVVLTKAGNPLSRENVESHFEGELSKAAMTPPLQKPAELPLTSDA